MTAEEYVKHRRRRAFHYGMMDGMFLALVVCGAFGLTYAAACVAPATTVPVVIVGSFAAYKVRDASARWLKRRWEREFGLTCRRKE